MKRQRLALADSKMLTPPSAEAPPARSSRYVGVALALAGLLATIGLVARAGAPSAVQASRDTSKAGITVKADAGLAWAALPAAMSVSATDSFNAVNPFYEARFTSPVLRAPRALRALPPSRSAGPVASRPRETHDHSLLGRLRRRGQGADSSILHQQWKQRRHRLLPLVRAPPTPPRPHAPHARPSAHPTAAARHPSLRRLSRPSRATPPPTPPASSPAPQVVRRRPATRPHARKTTQKKSTREAQREGYPAQSACSLSKIKSITAGHPTAMRYGHTRFFATGARVARAT